MDQARQRRTQWMLFVAGIVLVLAYLVLGSLRDDAKPSLLARYASVGIGMMLAISAAMNLLPRGASTRKALWVLWFASAALAFGGLYVKLIA